MHRVGAAVATKERAEHPTGATQEAPAGWSLVSGRLVHVHALVMGERAHVCLAQLRCGGDGARQSGRQGAAVGGGVAAVGLTSLAVKYGEASQPQAERVLHGRGGLPTWEVGRRGPGLWLTSRRPAVAVRHRRGADAAVGGSRRGRGRLDRKRRMRDGQSAKPQPRHLRPRLHPTSAWLDGASAGWRRAHVRTVGEAPMEQAGGQVGHRDAQAHALPGQRVQQ